MLLDTLHRDTTIAGLIPDEERLVAGRRVLVHRSITPDGSRVEKETRLIHAETQRVERTYRESVRMYSGDELRDLFERAGFSDTALYGGLDGSAFGAGGSRSVIVARRDDR